MSNTPSERAFLADYDASRFPRPSVAVDVALLTVADGELRVLLVRRSEEPQAGRMALPGTFCGIDEDLDAAASRVLRDKVGLEHVFVEQLYTFGAPGRDPRTRVISVAYFALVDAARLGSAETVAIADATDLAFDHGKILTTAVERLRGKLAYVPIGFELLPETFPLRALQRIHEAILERPLNKDSFRRTVLASGLVASTGAFEEDVGHRPAEIYRYTGD